jgi:hypothetical protein
MVTSTNAHVKAGARNKGEKSRTSRKAEPNRSRSKTRTNGKKTRRKTPSKAASSRLNGTPEPARPLSKNKPVLPDMVQNGFRPTDHNAGSKKPAPVTEPIHPADQVMGHPFWIATSESTRPVCVPTWVLDLVTEANEILVLAQINYWFRPSAANENKLRVQAVVGGQVWLAKTFADLGNEVHRNERQIEKAIAALKKKGFVIVEPHRSKHYHGMTVSHIRLDWDAIAAAHDVATQKRGGNGDVCS